MQSNDYETIQQYIRRAQIERSVYLAEVIAQTLVNVWNGARGLAARAVAVARAKRGQGNVFTFDAR